MAEKNYKPVLSEEAKELVERLRRLPHEEQVEVVKSLRGLWIVHPFYGFPPKEFFAISRELGLTADAINKGSTRYNMFDEGLKDLLSPSSVAKDVADPIVKILKDRRNAIFARMKEIRKTTKKGKLSIVDEA